ncbi:MAG: hypothetical protein VXU42_03045 [Verrucomicrobiota bacterium]|nr:hypothetical protein [Verrucomicrobiota bacterium]
MMELLGICWTFLVDTGLTLWGLAQSVGLLGWDLLVALHVNHPRLEGLLIGVGLAWLLARRDKHPLLRAASSPLNLVISILDLAWDHVVEFCGDIWGTLKGWVRRSWKWCEAKWIWGIKDPVMRSLRWTKAKLARKEEKKEE